MVAAKSIHSKIYHRENCRYVASIQEEAISIFRLEKTTLRGFRPCKCCCSMEGLYKKSGKMFKRAHEEWQIETTVEGNDLLITTPHYCWKAILKPSSQFIRLYQLVKNEQTGLAEYKKDTRLEGVTELSNVMGIVANEEKVYPYPVPFREQALQIESYAREQNVSVTFRNNEMIVVTDIAAWKTVYNPVTNKYRLFHSPFDGKEPTIENAEKAKYHLQNDVAAKGSPYTHIQYLVKHDRAKKISAVDYRKLPHTTKAEKKYYQQAEKRDRRNKARRLDKLFKQIENERKQKEAAQAV